MTTVAPVLKIFNAEVCEWQLCLKHLKNILFKWAHLWPWKINFQGHKEGGCNTNHTSNITFYRICCWANRISDSLKQWVRSCISFHVGRVIEVASLAFMQLDGTVKGTFEVPSNLVDSLNYFAILWEITTKLLRNWQVRLIWLLAFFWIAMFPSIQADIFL